MDNKNYKVTVTGQDHFTFQTDDYDKALKYYMNILGRLQSAGDHHQDVTLYGKEKDVYKVMDQRYKFEYMKGSCAVCGCHWYKACPGGCSWAEPGLCSRCAEKGGKNDTDSNGTSEAQMPGHN